MVYVAGMGSFLSQFYYPTQHHWGWNYLTICACKGRSLAFPIFPEALVLSSRLHQPAVLTNVASNLPHQPFPGVCWVKLPLRWVLGRGQTPVRGGGKQRNKTSYFCQLSDLKFFTLCNFAQPGPTGGRLSGAWQDWLWELGQAPAHPSSCQLWGWKNWKIQIIFPCVWVKQE